MEEEVAAAFKNQKAMPLEQVTNCNFRANFIIYIGALFGIKL